MLAYSGQIGLVCLQAQVEIQMGIAFIMKYFLNENIQNIFLEQLANLYAYDLKERPKSQGLIGHNLLKL